MKQVEIEQAPDGADALAAAPSQRAMVLRRLAGPLLSVGIAPAGPRSELSPGAHVCAQPVSGAPVAGGVVHPKKGGHHFDGGYQPLARQMLDELPAHKADAGVAC